MIKLYDSLITQIMPRLFAEKPEAQALAIAIRKQIRKILDYADTTAVYAVIDSVSEDVLDMLAAEVDTQHYSSELSLDIKRQLIKNALLWHAKAGTRGAVEELVGAIWDDAAITVWYEDETGEMEPGYFSISINSSFDYESYQALLQGIDNVKNASAHLYKVISTETEDMGLCTATVPILSIVDEVYGEETDISASYTWYSNEEGYILTDESGNILVTLN